MTSLRTLLVVTEVTEHLCTVSGINVRIRVRVRRLIKRVWPLGNRWAVSVRLSGRVRLLSLITV